MTKYELMVIAAAAAAFVLINIIMWSIIIAKERRSRRKNAQTAMTAIPASVAEQIPQINPAADFHAQELTPEPPVQQRPRVKRSDFVLLDDIVIVHTDERII